jgi:uncharacterized repeat protein (TIGR03803 family)
MVIASVSTPAMSAEKVLHAFKGGSDGKGPAAPLTSDKAGNLYGTTTYVGEGGCEYGGCGTVFKVAPDGKETVLYAFKGGADGQYPYGGLIADKAGNFYGTTGGEGEAGSYGTVFKLAPNGTETILYAFLGGSDGSGPLGKLLADANGNLYGVTWGGGSYSGSDCTYDGCGTVFELSATGTKMTLYTFQGGSDGWRPLAGLIMDQAGNLYGTTDEGVGGGASCPGGSLGCGSVFKLAPEGAETILYAFQGGSDGWGPEAGLIVDQTGNLYGTTAGGGGCSFAIEGCGTVFKVTPSGSETVLYSFQGESDGWAPDAGVILDRVGNLYGTTPYGGGTSCRNSGCGTAFKLAPNGRETVLYAFRAKEGRNPLAGLLMGKHDILYGTASAGGGKHNDGVVFSVTTK